MKQSLRCRLLGKRSDPHGKMRLLKCHLTGFSAKVVPTKKGNLLLKCMFSSFNYLQKLFTITIIINTSKCNLKDSLVHVLKSPIDAGEFNAWFGRFNSKTRDSYYHRYVQSRII